MTQPFESPFAVPDSDVAAAEYAAEQEREWSKWEATATIMHGNAAAFLESHPVPIGHVARFGYARSGLVRLQHRFIERNPEDADVQRFTAFGEKYGDHPDVRAYNRYLEARKASEAAAAESSAASNPFADGSADEKSDSDGDSGAGSAPAATVDAAPNVSSAAGVTAADAEAPTEPAGKPAGKARSAKISASEGDSDQ